MKPRPFVVFRNQDAATGSSSPAALVDPDARELPDVPLMHACHNFGGGIDSASFQKEVPAADIGKTGPAKQLDSAGNAIGCRIYGDESSAHPGINRPA